MEKDIWSDILRDLEEVISRPNFNTWLKGTRLILDQTNRAKITVPNAYNKEWLEKNLLEDILSRLKAKNQQIKAVTVVIRPTENNNLQELPIIRSLSTPTKKKSPPNPLNPRYSLDTFIVGNNNRLAFAAAQAVAQKPGEAYNPLFIYGGVGLGKTHLMHAIGNEILRHNPEKSIIYTSCETFTSEFIQALQEKTISEFKKKYRNSDVFLIDDIQFLANKEGTQEEFFHTFNILHQANRQIVITSDRVPKEIPQLEERLSSRFGWGMVADIQSPNYETRVAILGAKAKEKGLNIEDKVLEYIASHIVSNIRELEGCLTRLSAASQSANQAIDIPFTAQILKDFLEKGGEKVSAKKILLTTAQHFELEVADLLGKKRKKEIVYPRQMAMYLLRHKLNFTFPQIGEVMGGKDHTTVIYGVEKIEKNLKNSASVEADLDRINQLLLN